MNFEKYFNGRLVNLRLESFVDRSTGEEMRFYRLDIVGLIDDETQVVQLTCGIKQIPVDDYESYVGKEYTFHVVPRVRGRSIAPRLIGMEAVK